MARQTLRGTLAAVFVTSAPNDLDAPTTAELDAGTDLIGSKNSEALAELSGFQESASTIPTPDFTSLKTGNIEGEVTFDDSSMEFYSDDTVTTIFDALVPETDGYVVLMHEGRGVGKPTDVWPVTVQTRTRLNTGGNEAAKYMVAFSTGEPNLDGAEDGS